MKYQIKRYSPAKRERICLSEKGTAGGRGGLSVEETDQSVEFAVELPHLLRKFVLPVELTGDDTFVAVGIGRVIFRICGVIVHIHEPVPAHNTLRLHQVDDEILVEIAARSLRVHYPAGPGPVGETRMAVGIVSVGVFALDVKFGHETGRSGHFSPVVESGGVRLPVTEWFRDIMS